MQNLHRLLVLASTFALASLAVAQPSGADGERRGSGSKGGGPDRPGSRGSHPILRVIDADKNGTVSATELAGAPAAIIALDANADGIVTKAEMRPARVGEKADRPSPSGEGGRPATSDRPEHDGAPTRPVDPVMLALDADSNGDLSALEIANATQSLKTALDANKDGELTHDEVRPLPPVKAAR